MVRKLTIALDDDVYLGLKAKVGQRRIGRFLNDLARPLVSEAALLEGYRQMADAEANAGEWVEDLYKGAVGDERK
jgi:hypothetical protein